MANYTLRLLGPSDTIIRVFEREYQNALDALDAAEALSTRGTIEVWSKDARIARVKKDNKPAGPEDSIPG